jgi:hypothetical protein
LTSAQAQEQEIEYGQKAEMRGARTIFIDSGTNLRFRENAIALLKKELPAVTVSDKLSDAELLLQVSIIGSDRGHGHAQMLVTRSGSKPNVPRLLAKYEDEKSSVFTFKLSTVLMRRFIRNYRQANRDSTTSH